MPLPLALPIAMDQQAATAGLVEGTRLFEKGSNTVLDAVASPGKAKFHLHTNSRMADGKRMVSDLQ